MIDAKLIDQWAREVKWHGVHDCPTLKAILGLAAAHGANTMFESIRQPTVDALMEAIQRGVEQERARIPVAHEIAAQRAKSDMTLVVTAYEHHQYRPMGAPGEVRIHGIFASQYALPDGSIAGDFQWLADQYKADPNTRRLDALVTLESAQTQADVLLAEIERLRNALHGISLASRNSGCTKEDLGNGARKALEVPE